MAFETTQINFKKKSKFCINILPFLYEELIRLSDGNINNYLEYLYEKHKKKILALKISPWKGTSTAEYQPIHQEYQKIVLNNINPFLWRKYWELRSISGYSISYIIRLFLGWELFECSCKRSPTVKKKFSWVDLVHLYQPQPINNPSNNYVVLSYGMRHNNMLKIIFWDDN